MNIRNFDLNLLRVLDALVADRSATRAALRLGLSQSATSSALARLRHAVNDPLFVRTSDGLIPTATALALAEPARNALQQVGAALESTVPFNPAETQERFRIRAADHTLKLLLPRLLKVLNREAPQLKLDFLPLTGADSYEQLRLGELDIMISYFFGKLPDNLKVTRLFSESSYVMIRRDHPAIRRKITLEQYAEAEHVVLRLRGAWLTSHIDRAMAKLGLTRKIKIALSSHLLAPYCVQNSDLVASIPERLAREFARSFPVRIFPLPMEIPTFDISMVWHERAHHNKAHRWLRRQIENLRNGG